MFVTPQAAAALPAPKSTDQDQSESAHHHHHLPLPLPPSFITATMSAYYYGPQHHQPSSSSSHSSASSHNHHGGRSRRAPRLSASQNSHRPFRGVRSMKELTESPSTSAFRLRFEAGRSFDLDDDLEFCPGLLTEDDVSANDSEPAIWFTDNAVFNGCILICVFFTVAIYPLLLIRWLSLQRLTSLLSTPAPDPAAATSHPQLLTILRGIEQLLQSRHWLPIKQQPANEAPPTCCLAHAQRHPDSQPQYGHAGPKPTFIDIARHDAAAPAAASAADVCSSLVARAAGSGTLRFRFLMKESFRCIVVSPWRAPHSLIIPQPGFLFGAVVVNPLQQLDTPPPSLSF